MPTFNQLVPWSIIQYKAFRLLSLLMLCGFLGLTFVLTTPASAQDNDKIINADAVLDAARGQINKVQKRLDGQADVALTDAELVELRAQALEAQTNAEAVAAAIGPQLASVQARVAQLGEPSQDVRDTADVAVQRAQLDKSNTNFSAQLKLAGLIVVEAQQAADRILKLRRSQFQAQLGKRAASILAPPFWNELLSEWPRDVDRLIPLRNELAAAVVSAWPAAWVLVALGVVGLLGLWILARRILVSLATKRVAPGRLRRSLYAVALVMLTVIIPGLVAQLAVLGLSWDASLSDATTGSLKWLVGVVFFGGFIAGLGYALLQPDRPSWRLAPMLDVVALGLRWYPLMLATLVVLGWTLQRVAMQINVSLASTVALDCVLSLALNVVVILALNRARQLRLGFRQDPEKGVVLVSPLWLTVLMFLIWLALAFSVACLLAGYVALGSFIVKQLIWCALVLGSAYLLSVLIDDGCSSVLAAIRRSGDAANIVTASTRARSQAVVLLSGFARLLVAVFALSLLFVPYGEGPVDWLRRADSLYSGVFIGEIQIRPISVLLALLVLVVGFACIRVLKAWLVGQYLPTTSLDAGMRSSAASLFSYAGYVLAVALAMSAVGIGLERVAWIASALSVGIGFGLQAVVQNFVSGLILLAERPVKVGDWVSLGGIEGDIRRINVRATEIQMSDRSTVIVPNSEFITKIVRNVTHANPLGRVQFFLAMPLSTDAEQARTIILATLIDCPDVLDEPAPNVLLDGIDTNGLTFKATGYVGSPRTTGGVRSFLLFDVLKRLSQAGLPLSTPSSIFITGPKTAETASEAVAVPPLPLA